MLSKKSAARALGLAPRLSLGSCEADQVFCLGRCGVGLDAHATNRRDATHAQAGCGGGRMRRRASVLRFCTMAARWNSSRAPERPRSRSRSNPMVGLQVREAHLDALALIARFEERLGLHLAPRHVARIFVDVACHIARRLLGAALRSQRTGIAIALAGTEALSAVRVDGSAGSELLAIGADVDAASPVPSEVRGGEGAILALGAVPHRDVRCDLLLLNEPAQELARAVGRVGRQPLRLQIEAGFGAVEHRLGGGDLVVGSGRRRLHVDDDGVRRCRSGS